MKADSRKRLVLFPFFSHASCRNCVNFDVLHNAGQAVSTKELNTAIFGSYIALVQL